MSVITGLPIGAMDPDAPVYANSPVMVPLSPADNAAYTEVVGTTTATTHELTGHEMVKIQTTDYPARFRFLTDADTAAVTAANARDYVAAWSAEYYAIPSGATGMSGMTIGGNAKVIIVEF